MKLIAFPAALVLCASAYAQTTPAPATADTAPPPAVAVPSTTTGTGEPVAFQTKLTPGTVRAYKISVTQKGTLTIGDSGMTMPADSTLNATAKLFVDKQNPDGSYAVRYKLGGAKMTSSMGMAPSIPDSEVKGTIGKDGTFTPAETSKKKGMIMGMDPGQQLNGILSRLSMIPTSAVAVGQTFTTTVPVPMDPTGKMTMTINSKVLAVDTTAKGDRVARVQRDYNAPMNVNMKQPVEMSMSGTLSGTGTGKVDLSSGQPVDDLSKAHVLLTIVAPNPQGNGEKQNIGVDMNVTTHVEAGAPVPYTPPAPAKK